MTSGRSQIAAASYPNAMSQPLKPCSHACVYLRSHGRTSHDLDSARIKIPLSLEIHASCRHERKRTAAPLSEKSFIGPHVPSDYEKPGSHRPRTPRRSASTEATKDALQGLNDSTQIRTVLPRSACIVVTPHGTSPDTPSASVTYDDFPDTLCVLVTVTGALAVGKNSLK